MTSSSSLTVAKLKALCVLHDLPTSGKKADLVERLLEAGLDANTLGLEMEPSEEADTEEVTISLESIDSAPAPPPAEVPGAKDTVPLPAVAST